MIEQCMGIGKTETGNGRIAAQPVRTCVICRKTFPKHELARYVCPDRGGNGLVPDRQGRLPGRGFYVCREPACLERFPGFKGWLKKCNRG